MRSCSHARALLILSVLVLAPFGLNAQDAAKRPMTFLDVQHLRQAASLAVSPDRQLVLYTLSVPDWKEAKRQTDIYVVGTKDGLSSTRQLTFTKEKNEASPAWARDGSFFAFLSNRDAPAGSATQNQLYAMRVDGGEARQITSAWARHMVAASERNLRISASFTCSAKVAGLAVGLTSESLMESTAASCAMAVCTAWIVSSA